MKLHTTNSISYYKYVESPLCIAGVSTRIGGVSKGVYNSLNLGLNSGDNLENIKKNRQLFFGTIAPEFQIVNLEQTHSNTVISVNSDFENNTQGDAFYTTQQGILLTINLADCGSIILHDENFSIVAAIHSGWRGTKDGIIEKTISELSTFVKPETLIAYIGPTIQQQYYEVGAEFFDHFPHRYLKTTNSKHYFNLNSRIEDILIDSGVGRVMNSRMGTFGVPEYFYSYRRDGATGRMCAYIGIV